MAKIIINLNVKYNIRFQLNKNVVELYNEAKKVMEYFCWMLSLQKNKVINQ
jgi:hypothetical protein